MSILKFEKGKNVKIKNNFLIILISTKTFSQNIITWNSNYSCRKLPAAAKPRNSVHFYEKPNFQQQKVQSAVFTTSIPMRYILVNCSEKGAKQNSTILPSQQHGSQRHIYGDRAGELVFRQVFISDLGM